MGSRPRLALASLVVGSVLVGALGANGDVPAAADEAPRSEYLVQLTKGALARDVTAPSTILEDLSGDLLRGFVASLTPSEASNLKTQRGVIAVEPNARVSIPVSGSPDVVTKSSGSTAKIASTATSWGLDRIDQKKLPLNGRFTPVNNAAGTHVYVVDTGLNASHPEFRGRVGAGAYVVDDGRGISDCNGHGTHVAGIIASNYFGVARQAIIHPVRALDCQGTADQATIVDSLNWVADRAPRGSVVNMSFGSPASSIVNQAVTRMAQLGLIPVVAAGNEARNACGYSPASAEGAITVAAADRNDADTPFSNAGVCVDIYAPGVDIASTHFQDSNMARVSSGTSAAAPHVAGAAAVYLASHPRSSTAQVAAGLDAQGSHGVLKNLVWNSPNVLVNVPQAKIRQVVSPRPPSRLKTRRSVTLKARTTAGTPVTWRSSTRASCSVRGNRLTGGRKPGTCRLRAVAAGSESLLPLAAGYTIRIQRR